jgi:hypothetical protein
MSKLPVSSAARVLGMARSTLRGLISRGKVHVEEGNLVDTAELERAGYRLQPDALALEEARLQGRSLDQTSDTAETQRLAGLDQGPYLLREQFARLREELDQAHTRHMAMLRTLEQLSRQLSKTSGSRRASTLVGPPQPQLRKPIMALLQDHPNGLTRKDIETALNIRKNLQDVLQGMIRAGLIVRPKSGIFAVAPEHRVTETEQGTASPAQPETTVRA